MKRLHSLLLVFMVALLASSGCSGDSLPGPREILDRAMEKAREISASSEALVFAEMLSMRLESGLGDFEQLAEMVGTIEMPSKEGYESLESWSGSLMTLDVPPQVALSYVTLDGGKTAYIMGSQLEARLGAAGWVYLTPPAEQNPYFNYLETVKSVAGYAEEVTLAGEEELNGITCWHLEVKPSVDALLQEQFDANQAFREKYQDAGIGELVKEARAEIWISREGFLPIRIYSMVIIENVEAGETITFKTQADFGGYGEKPEFPVDAPAIYTKV